MPTTKRLVASVSALAALLALGACSSDAPAKTSAGSSASVTTTTQPPSFASCLSAPRGATAPPEFASELPLIDGSEVVSSQVSGATVNVVALVASTDFNKVIDFYVEAVAAKGWTVDHREAEEADAELEFSKNGREGHLQVTPTKCPTDHALYTIVLRDG